MDKVAIVVQDNVRKFRVEFVMKGKYKPMDFLKIITQNFIRSGKCILSLANRTDIFYCSGGPCAHVEYELPHDPQGGVYVCIDDRISCYYQQSLRARQGLQTARRVLKGVGV